MHSKPGEQKKLLLGIPLLKTMHDDQLDMRWSAWVLLLSYGLASSYLFYEAAFLFLEPLLRMSSS